MAVGVLERALQEAIVRSKDQRSAGWSRLAGRCSWMRSWAGRFSDQMVNLMILTCLALS